MNEDFLRYTIFYRHRLLQILSKIILKFYVKKNIYSLKAGLWAALLSCRLSLFLSFVSFSLYFEYPDSFLAFFFSQPSVRFLSLSNLSYTFLRNFYLSIVCNYSRSRISKAPHGRNTTTRRHSRRHRKCLADSFYLH